MPRYALKLEYNGAPFHGWQRQAGGLKTVQGALEAALSRVDPTEPEAVGAGRTDTGVHAAGQVAHVDMDREWDAFRLNEALNHHLKPDPVAVVAAAPVETDFHARFSAVGREYCYRIISRRAPLVFEAGLAWRISYALSAEPMRQAATALIGKHDFTTFRATLCQAASPVKTLDAIEINEIAHGLDLTFKARSFLHNQVRSMVGSLECVGSGRWEPERMGDALAAADRAACGPVAPPDGLSLIAVTYNQDPFAPRG